MELISTDLWLQKHDSSHNPWIKLNEYPTISICVGLQWACQAGQIDYIFSKISSTWDNEVFHDYIDGEVPHSIWIGMPFDQNSKLDCITAIDKQNSFFLLESRFFKTETLSNTDPKDLFSKFEETKR